MPTARETPRSGPDGTKPGGRYPIIYEINTRSWLKEWEHSTGASPFCLQDVPESQFGEWRAQGFRHIWLMGVWKVGLEARRHAEDHCRDEARAYPSREIAGSPFAVAAYEVCETIGGREGLRVFRERLHSHGLRLLLDFVPNHLGLDHPWVRERPGLFVRSSRRRAGTFRPGAPAPDPARPAESGLPPWCAHGKDPFFPAWTDTVQLDFRLQQTHDAMTEQLLAMAELADGARCDMSMLLLKDVFRKNWEAFPPDSQAEPATAEFWDTAIRAVKKRRPDFLFLAEVYWGLDGVLRRHGFDLTYQKGFYDALLRRNPSDLQRFLFDLAGDRNPGGRAEAPLEDSVLFLENHDEPRIASLLSHEEHEAAALLLLGLPSACLLHEGQLAGRRIHSRIQFVGHPPETPHPLVSPMYRKLLALLPGTEVRRGSGELLQPWPAWEGNPSHSHFLIAQWSGHSALFNLVVVNFSPHTSQCHCRPTVPHLDSQHWRMRDLLGSEVHERSGAVMAERGLYLELPPFGARLFSFAPVAVAPAGGGG